MKRLLVLALACGAIFGGVSAQNADAQIVGGCCYSTYPGTKYRDFVTGHSGNSLLYGKLNRDRLNGAAGNDWLYGGRGNDVLLDGAGYDYINCGRGTDLVLLTDFANVYVGCENFGGVASGMSARSVRRCHDFVVRPAPGWTPPACTVP